MGARGGEPKEGRDGDGVGEIVVAEKVEGCGTFDCQAACTRAHIAMWPQWTGLNDPPRMMLAARLRQEEGGGERKSASRGNVSVIRHTSHVTRHTPHITHHTPHTTHHTPHTPHHTHRSTHAFFGRAAMPSRARCKCCNCGGARMPVGGGCWRMPVGGGCWRMLVGGSCWCMPVGGGCALLSTPLLAAS